MAMGVEVQGTVFGWQAVGSLQASAVENTPAIQRQRGATGTVPDAMAADAYEDVVKGSLLFVFVKETDGLGGTCTIELQGSFNGTTWFTTHTITLVTGAQAFRIFPLATPYVRMKFTETSGTTDATLNFNAEMVVGPGTLILT